MPTIERFEPRPVGEKGWGEELLIGHAEGLYTLKRLTYRAGAKGPLQYHKRKDETFYLHSGLAAVTYESGGALITVDMNPGESFRIPPGAVHQFCAFSECVVFEASTPFFDDRVNVEEQYR